jgi:hypothetical protein
MFVAFLSLHILLCGEVLLYYLTRPLTRPYPISLPNLPIFLTRLWIRFLRQPLLTRPETRISYHNRNRFSPLLDFFQIFAR